MCESSIPIRKGLPTWGRIVCCLSLFIPSTPAREVVGSIRFAHCSVFESHLLKLVGFKTDGAERVIELKIPSESVIEREKDWIEVPATVECARSRRHARYLAEAKSG